MPSPLLSHLESGIPGEKKSNEMSKESRGVGWSSQRCMECVETGMRINKKSEVRKRKYRIRVGTWIARTAADPFLSLE